MIKHLRFLSLLIFLVGLCMESGWSQLLNTLYTHREIDFFGEEEELEDFDKSRFQLIPHVDIFINFNAGIGFIAEKENFKVIEELLNTVQDEKNQGRSETNQLEYFRKNKVKPYQIGINLDIFIFDYFGIGFTYSRNHYFSHLKSISTSSSLYSTNYYNETVDYRLNAFGNNYQFSIMGRYPFGNRLDNNIFLIGGLGYSIATLEMTLNFDDKINGDNRKQDYSSTSHSFHFFAELVFKVEHFNFGFGLLAQTTLFDNYTFTENPEFIPVKYEAIKLGPTLYFKVGFNL